MIHSGFTREIIFKSVFKQELSQLSRGSMLFSKIFFSKFMVVFGYLMAVVYIGLGGMLFLPQTYPNVPVALKFSFALFFISYGLFRLVKMITKKPYPND
jgi:hypothetical protein